MDGKGRILVSKKKRDRLGEPFVMAVDDSGCIVAYPEQTWAEMVGEILNYRSLSQGRKQYTRLLARMAEDDLRPQHREGPAAARLALAQQILLQPVEVGVRVARGPFPGRHGDGVQVRTIRLGTLQQADMAQVDRAIVDVTVTVDEPVIEGLPGAVRVPVRAAPKPVPARA